MRFRARGDAAGTVALAVTCSDHGDETLAVVIDFITPLQRRLAGALRSEPPFTGRAGMGSPFAWKAE